MNFFLILLVFLSLPSAGDCFCPRLIITLGPRCHFTPETLQKKVGGHVVDGASEEIKREIIELDRTSGNHIFILKAHVDDFYSFAYNIGYPTLYLNSSYDRSLKKLTETLVKIPTTDKVLPRTPPLQVGLFYDLMMKVDTIFKEHGILYWGTCGTLLGAVRHQGMIPWDDDIDIAIFDTDVPLLLSLKKTLNEQGLGIYYHAEYEIYKIFFLQGNPIIYEDGTLCPWKFPFIDVLPLTEIEGKITYAGYWQKDWKDLDFFWLDELQIPLQELPFGPLFIPAPHNPVEYVKRMYGADWNDVAYVSYSHRQEKFLEKIKVKLLDRSSPRYILPSH